MLITQDQEKGTRDLELGGGLESGDDGDYVIRIQELEEQLSAKGGRTHSGRPHEARNVLCKLVKKSHHVHIIFPELFLLKKIQILEAPAKSTAP